MKVQAYGIFWFKDAAQFHEYKKVFADSEVLAVSFSDWLKDANKIVRRFESHGATIVKAYAEPSEFVAWCSSNGKTVNAEGRMAFANSKAYDYLVSKG